MTKDELIALKPCPFCGGEARISQHEPSWDTSAWVAYCYAECGAGISKKLKGDAIAAWNTRAHATTLGD